MSLQTITQLVNDKLRSESLGDLVDDDRISRAITQALIALSVDAPQQLSADVLASGSAVQEPNDWADATVSLVGVEYPVGQVPAAMVRAERVKLWGGLSGIVLQDLTLPADTQVRVLYTAAHAADGSTVPADQENAVACWTAAELCRQAATKAAHDRDATIQAANTNQQSQASDLTRRANDWMAQYRTQLGLPDPSIKVGGKPVGVVVTPDGDGHRRGRFASLGY